MQAPKTYSPQEMAGAQGAASREAAQTGAIVNNTNQQTPFGNVNYSIAGYETIKDANGEDVQVPRYNQTTTLSEGQQGLLDRTTALGTKGLDLAGQQIDRLGQTLNTPFTTDNLPAANSPTLNTNAQPMSAAQADVQVGHANTAMTPMGAAAQSDASRQAMGASPTSLNQQQVNTGGAGVGTYGGNLNQANARTGVGPSDFSQDRQNVENALLSRIEPQFQRDEAAMRTRLANQGLMPGAEASNADLDTLNRARNDARMQAVLAGGQEQSRQFQNQLNQGAFFNAGTGQNNQARQAEQNFGLGVNAQNNATRLAGAADQRAAIGQNNASNLAGGQFAQAGVGQNNAANMASYQAYLQATGQNNQAVGQNNQANLASQALQNQAIGQNNQANVAQGEFRNQSVGQNNAANMASYQAQNQALADQYGMNLTGRQNAFTESLATRNQPINEISALMNGGQVQVPSFQQPYRQGVETTNIAGMMGQQNQQNQQNYNNNLTGMFGLGSSLLGGLFSLSDKRAKKNITRVGKTDDGHNIYRYQYKKGVGGNGMFQLGVMAQEVAKTRPDAVATGPDGLMRVDYGKVA